MGSFFRIAFETFAIEVNSISNCFRNFCNRSQLKQPFSSNFSISNCNQLKLGHKFEPQFELELKSNLNSNSVTVQRAREASAFIKNNKRRRLWEPSDMGMWCCFRMGGLIF